MSPLVSVLIPAYNADRWLGSCLDSVLSQTWKRKEIIIVDDGSTDQTLLVARQFERRNIKVVRQVNQGAAAARNKAFSISQGDYVQWLDADDLLGANKIARQVQVLEESGDKWLLASCAWGRFRYRPHRAEFKPTGLWCDLPSVEWLRRKMNANLHMQTATWLISREVTEAAGPWDSSMYVDDDGEYLCRVLLHSSGIRFVTGAAVYYRTLANGSLSHIGRSDKKMEAQWRSMQLHVDALLSLETSDRTKAACVAHLQTWIQLFHPERPDLTRQAEELARNLGGSLTKPKVKKKYRWINMICGTSTALRAQRFFPRVKATVHDTWDGMASRLEFGAAESQKPDRGLVSALDPVGSKTRQDDPR